jgi:hypothetical protein
MEEPFKRRQCKYAIFKNYVLYTTTTTTTTPYRLQYFCPHYFISRFYNGESIG